MRLTECYTAALGFLIALATSISSRRTFAALKCLRGVIVCAPVPVSSRNFQHIATKNTTILHLNKCVVQLISPE